jgi:hypothetical protein
MPIQSVEIYGDFGIWIGQAIGCMADANLAFVFTL